MTKRQIQIAEQLSLPLDFVTQTIGVLAKRRAGKSYTAAKIVEQLASAGQQVVIADPKGDWWGLRSSADGKGPGLPILILGGEHGDLPLEPGAGELIAQLVVEEGLSVLLDLSMFRRNDRTTFMTAFLEKVYLLKAQERYRTAMMLVIDEADAIIPQKPRKDEERMLDAADDIVRRGGQRGLGCMMVTQRSSVINKNVLTQVEVMVVLRTIAPQDLAAVGDWIDVHGTPEQRKELMTSLPALPVGTAWFWSPGWPTDAGIFQRVQVAQRETYDSGATPTAGQRRQEPRTLADVDLDVLQERMAATIERVQAADPAALRRRIAELEQELRQQRRTENQEPSIEYVETPVVLADDLAAARLLAEQMDVAAQALLKQADMLRTSIDEAVEQQRRPSVPARSQPAPARPPAPAAPAPARPQSPSQANGVDDMRLPLAERKILTVLAQHGQRTKKQVGLLAGYSIKGGGFNNALGALRTKGFITGKDYLQMTNAGQQALGSWEPLPTGSALIEYWMQQLGKAERAILGALVNANGQARTKQQVAAEAGYEPTGGGFNNALGRLRTLELIEGTNVELRASRDLIEV